MTNSKRHKRQRRETSVPHSTYSNDEESDLDEKEYRRKSKGKEKLQEEDKSEDAQEEEEKGVGSTDKSDGSVQICGICLTEDEVERGKLDCCDHCFCFGCIMEWAKVESRCPTCKQRFVTIVRPPLPGVPRSRPRTFRIPHRNQVGLLITSISRGKWHQLRDGIEFSGIVLATKLVQKHHMQSEMSLFLERLEYYIKFVMHNGEQN